MLWPSMDSWSIYPCCTQVRLILTITTPVCVYTSVYYDILLYPVCARAVCVLRAVSFGSSFLIFCHLFSSFLIFWTGTLLHFSDRISFCVCGTLGTHFGIHFELFVFLVSLGGAIICHGSNGSNWSQTPPDGVLGFSGLSGLSGLAFALLEPCVCVCVVLKILVKIQTSARQLPSLSFACLYVCVWCVCC